MPSPNDRRARTPDRASKPLKRSLGTAWLRRRFLIYCEGQVTERIYLDGIKQQLRNGGVEIVVGSKHGEPLGLVEAAVKHAKQFKPKSPERFDEVWCVFDVEAPIPHGSLAEALRCAERENVGCAVSNPCFELWLLLHFGDHRGHLSTEQACELLEAKKCCGYTVDRKRFEYGTVRPSQDAALRRAVQLTELHGEAPVGKRNPSTSFHLLLDALRNGSMTVSHDTVTSRRETDLR
jgi:hypothetical protein